MGRAGGDLDGFQFAGINAVHAYCGAFGYAVHVLEIGVKNDVTTKSFVLIADEKESSTEQYDGGGNENSNDHIMVFHATSAPL